MTTKQDIVFLLGITLLVMVFWVNGYWGILQAGILRGPGNPSGSANSKAPNLGGGAGFVIPTPFGTFPLP